MGKKQRKRIMISGYYGFGNAGDEAILAAIIQMCREMIPGVEIVVLSENPDSTKKEHGVEAVDRKNAGAVFLKMTGSDVLLSGGGGLVQDSTGFSTVFYYLSLVQMAKTMGKKVMCFAQGFGPLSLDKSKKMAKFVMNQAHLITYRDIPSKNLSDVVGIDKPPIHITADPVFALKPAPESEVKAAAEKLGMSDGGYKIGISVRPWESKTDYTTLIAEAADRFVEENDAKVFIFPFQESQDMEVCRQVQNKMKNDAVIVERKYSIPLMMALMGKMDITIGMRLHSLIFSAVMGVPSIGVSYDPKVTNFMKMTGMPFMKIDALSAEGLEQMSAQLYLSHGILSKNLAERMLGLREQAERNVELLKEMMDW